MSTSTTTLPISDSITPTNVDELIDSVTHCFQDQVPLYPIGGATSLTFGVPVTQSGTGLNMTRLNGVVDYPSRDMTITVQSGITMATLAKTLQENNQCLPIDVPQQQQATLGAVVATNFNGPRRYGQATIRDYVIGISAVDGRGILFSGGGRVVKNVAGYDFCKLLTGSMGTLGVITQLTLKVRPIPQSSKMMTCELTCWNDVELLLSELVNSEATPTAIELCCGPKWNLDENIIAQVAVRLEGSNSEVHWMTDHLQSQWKQQGFSISKILSANEAEKLWPAMIEFPASDPSAMVLKANVVPSQVTSMIQQFQQVEPDVSILAHAGSGIVFAQLSDKAPADLAHWIITSLRPAARAAHGDLIVLAHEPNLGLTKQAIFGGNEAALQVMRSIKEQFDPRDILNRGRFIF